MFLSDTSSSPTRLLLYKRLINIFYIIILLLAISGAVYCFVQMHLHYIYVSNALELQKAQDLADMDYKSKQALAMLQNSMVTTAPVTPPTTYFFGLTGDQLKHLGITLLPAVIKFSISSIPSSMLSLPYLGPILHYLSLGTATSTQAIADPEVLRQLGLSVADIVTQITTLSAANDTLGTSHNLLLSSNQALRDNQAQLLQTTKHLQTTLEQYRQLSVVNR